MRLRDKQTGEVGDYTFVTRYGEDGVGVAKDDDIDSLIFFNSIAELNEKYEDVPEEKKYGGRVPKAGDKFWLVLLDGSLTEVEWGGDNVDEAFFEHGGAVWFESGNAFWTKEEAAKEAARRKAYVILKEDTKGFKPNWKNNDEEKYYVLYSHDLGRFSIGWNRQLDSGGKLYFATEEDAEATIKAHEKEWKTWLGVEE